jgi:hypothetical protein
VGAASVGGNGVLDHLLGEVLVFVVLDAPADDLAREDVDDGVEVEPDSADRTAEFCDVPGPDLRGPGGGQFGNLLR